MKQVEQVIHAMVNNGGYATLGHLYCNVDITQWGTKTPFASIRRIVQDKRHFFKIRPGLWGLNDYKQEVLAKFDLQNSKTVNDIQIFNHTYYQGLIVEIGNLKGYETYIPLQDQNKQFLQTPLKNISNLNTIYQFTYPHVVKRASGVDVTWFNQRKFPNAFFEVEHSTDFQNSLSKFSDLQDFNARFFIVSAEKKRSRFEWIMENYSLYESIKNYVEFVDYDYIAKLHAKTCEIVSLQQEKIAL
ncbi:MAG: hypothetical protein ACOCZS_00715 [Verrucomicrobiota bacterium]